jgi:AraC-like DNA-binding protein
MTIEPPRPRTLHDFRMADVTYQQVALAPGAELVRPAGVAGYFYHVLAGEVRIARSDGSPLSVRPRDTVVVGGFIAHTVRNVCGTPARLLIGVEPLEHIAWISAIPSMQFIAGNDASPLVSRLHLAIDLVMAECADPPGWVDQLTLERLAEIILFYFIRIGSPAPGQLEPFPWNDRRIASAVRAMTLDPRRDWTIDHLARIASMSRSAFAARFRQQLGDTPMRLLARIRLRAAGARMLQGATISEAAAQAGYDSQESFNRAFKRLFGITPGRWRRQQSG